jgi:hypothetical protein
MSFSELIKNIELYRELTVLWWGKKSIKGFFPVYSTKLFSKPGWNARMRAKSAYFVSFQKVYEKHYPASVRNACSF